MFLTVHATLGLIIGEQIGNIWLAYILGFISHFLLDLIPHGDKPVIFNPANERMELTLKAGVIDAFVMTITLFLLWQNNLIDNPLLAFVGALGAISPDLIVGVSLFLSHPWSKKFLPSPPNWLVKFHNFHKITQRIIRKIEYPMLPGLIFQYLLLIFFIFLLTKF